MSSVRSLQLLLALLKAVSFVSCSLLDHQPSHILNALHHSPSSPFPTTKQKPDDICPYLRHGWLTLYWISVRSLSIALLGPIAAMRGRPSFFGPLLHHHAPFSARTLTSVILSSLPRARRCALVDGLLPNNVSLDSTASVALVF